MRIMSADEWKHEQAHIIAEEKKVEADWKLLTKAQQYEKTNIKKAIAIYEGDYPKFCVNLLCGVE